VTVQSGFEQAALPRRRARSAHTAARFGDLTTDNRGRTRSSGLPITVGRISEGLCEPTMKHIIALLLENEPGALSRVVALFSARGYNIESLTVAPTEDASLSRMTIVTTGSDEVIEQITKHLNRLIEVVKVVDLTEGAFTERELMLIKVRAVGKEREEMKRMAEIFRARIIDVTEKSYTIELTGDQGKLDAFIGAVDRAVILETVRTGTSGIGRGERILRV
jgi:acetolactate synthase-1/3 small subunit